MRAAGFTTFLDEKDLQGRNDAFPEMDHLCLTAPICVMVLSEEYYKSKWCCREAAIFAERRNRWKSALNGSVDAKIQRAKALLEQLGLECYDISYPLIIPVFYANDPSGVPYGKVDGYFVRNAKGDPISPLFTGRIALVKALESITGIRRDQDMLDSKLVDMVVTRIQQVGLRTLRGMKLSSVSTSDILTSDLVNAQMVDLATHSYLNVSSLLQYVFSVFYLFKAVPNSLGWLAVLSVLIMLSMVWYSWMA